MKNIPSIFLFNQLVSEMFFPHLKLHFQDLEHFLFFSPNYYFAIHFNQLFIQSFHNKLEKNIVEFINYVKNLDQIKPPETLFNEYFKLMFHPDIHSIHFTMKISYQKIKEKIFLVKSINFFNTNINNETIQCILQFPNIQNLSFKNCSFDKDCNFSKIKNVKVNIEECNIESFSMFFNSNVNLKIKNTDIKMVGFGIYYGKDLELENTDIDTLFLKWNMPNLKTFVYKKNKIKNELEFLGYSAKNIENVIIEGHLLTLDFLNNLSTMINLKITGDKYRESFCISLTTNELNKLMCKYQNKLKLNIINSTFIKSIQLNGLSSIRHVLWNYETYIETSNYDFFTYVQSSKFIKNDGYYTVDNNHLVFHPVLDDTGTEFVNKNDIESRLNIYYVNGYPIYLKSDNICKNKEIKEIDVNEMVTILRDIIASTNSENISFDIQMELFFNEIRYFKVSIDIDLLKVLQKKFIDDLNIYFNLESYIRLIEEKKKRKEYYTKTLNEFCGIFLAKLDLFSKNEKLVILHILLPFINNELNLLREGNIHLSSTILKEVCEKQKVFDSMHFLLDSITLKLGDSFLLYQNKLSDLYNEYLKIFDELLIEEDDQILNLYKNE